MRLDETGIRQTIEIVEVSITIDCARTLLAGEVSADDTKSRADLIRRLAVEHYKLGVLHAGGAHPLIAVLAALLGALVGFIFAGTVP